MKKIKSYMLILVAVLPLLSILSSCKNEEEGLLPTQGEIRFQFTLQKTYTLNDLSDIRSVVITIEKDGVRQTLPSQSLNGDENIISTPYIALEAGTYHLVSYRAFNPDGNLIDILDITLEGNNEFIIKAQEQTSYALPVKVKQLISTDNYFNSLYALCLEVLGEDKSKWPKSWDFDEGIIDDSWAGLEFTIDDYGDPTNINGLIIDGEPKYEENKDGEWVNMALTEFKHMKKLPAVIGNMSSLVNLTIRNCDLEELPDELRFTNIVTLHIENTQLAQLPEAVADMKQLINVYLLNNQFTTFPEILTKNENIYHFIMVNEKINEVPASIKNWKYLANFMITGSNISTLPDVFNDVYHMSVLDFSNNKNLSTLPPSLLDTKVAYEGGGYTEKSIRGIILDGCSFTEIPASIIRPGIKMLSMKDNKIAELRKEDLEKMCDLNTLVLDRNPLTAFPQITHNQLGYLSLIGCGLTESDIDVTGMTNLSANHFFLTQEKYNEIMLPSINTDGTWN